MHILHIGAIPTYRESTNSLITYTDSSLKHPVVAKLKQLMVIHLNDLSHNKYLLSIQLPAVQGILLASHTLTVVTIDNIDILQSHAFVSTTDAKRSWHGTSIRCVQPSPKSLSFTEEEIISVNQAQKHPSSSPIASSYAHC